jgi:hypothetical protein
MYINIFDFNFYKNKKKTKIDSTIYKIFSDESFNKSYDIELKNYLRIFVYLEFRTRELFLQYINIPENFRNYIHKYKIGQPFRNTRLLFSELVKLNKIPDYTHLLISDNIEYNENNEISDLKVLYKSYYDLLERHTFEDKYMAKEKDINYEKYFIKEEFKDTNNFFHEVLNDLFKDNPKYKNIKSIHNSLKIYPEFILCDNCGKEGPKNICICGINIYCNESCQIKDHKKHYENCKFINYFLN